MAKYIQTVVTAPVAGREQEFDRWYDDIHLAELLAIPGFVSAQRYELAGSEVGERMHYLAVYEIETDDIGATLEAFTAAVPSLTLSDAIDQQATVLKVYRALGERRTAGSGAAGRATDIAARSA